LLISNELYLELIDVHEGIFWDSVGSVELPI